MMQLTKHQTPNTKHQTPNTKQLLGVNKPQRFSSFSFVLIALLSIFLFSCQDETIFLEENENLSQIVDDASVVNGRFFFSSKESLGQQIEKFEEEDHSALEIKFEKFYQKGFRSHSPIVNPENEVLLTKFAEEKAYISSLSQKNKSSEEEEETDFISDPFFAAIVNQDNEIIVGDTLYKYTAEKGLYFSHIKDSTHLFEFFKNEEANKILNSKSASVAPIDACLERELYGGVTTVDDEIFRYVAPIDEEGCGGGGSGGGSTTPVIPAVTAEENINTIINNLPICEGRRGNAFQSLFGKSYYCRSYWTDTRRIHTEFWSQSWLVYTSTGIMVKSQRKFLGLWNRSDVNELYLGINKILLKYNYEKPEIQFDPTSTYGYVSNRVPLYMYKQTFNILPNAITGFNDISVSVSKNNIPFFQFEDVDVLNIYIPNLPIINEYNLNLTTGDIYSQSNIKKLYKMGMDFLKTKINSNKDFVVTYQKTTDEIEVLYFGEQYHKNNEKIIKRYFHQDIGFMIGGGAKTNTDAGTNFDDNGEPYNVPNYTKKFIFETVDDFFRNYTYYDLDFYGMGRRGTTWKGNRMIKEDNN